MIVGEGKLDYDLSLFNCVLKKSFLFIFIFYIYNKHMNYFDASLLDLITTAHNKLINHRIIQT